MNLRQAHYCKVASMILNTLQSIQLIIYLNPINLIDHAFTYRKTAKISKRVG